MTDRNPRLEGMTPSVGGDLADLLGNLKALQTGNEYTDTMNPNGDPFKGIQSPVSMIKIFAATHPQSLQLLEERLSEFSKANTEEGQETPPVYQEAQKTLQEMIEMESS